MARKEPMDQKPTRTTDTQPQDAQQPEESVPPSVLGDVEDAVTPQAEGELTPWTPPDQPEGEDTED
jgi:hypothetical protein